VSTSGDPALQVRKLRYARGERQLIHDLSFTLTAGHWIHIQGSNGSGKTTLLRLLTGLLPAESGQILWQGQDIQGQYSIYQQALCYLGHTNGLKDELTPVEQLGWTAALRGTPINTAKAHQLLTHFGLSRQTDLPCQDLSQGQKRRVALARLGYTQAALWLLDEPFNALDDTACQQLQLQLEQHLAQGGLLILSSHQTVNLSGVPPQMIHLSSSSDDHVAPHV
jgi:heme exporter protein A